MKDRVSSLRDSWSNGRVNPALYVLGYLMSRLLRFFG
jgi:hypothetical protein